jgi:arylsulfatase A-like enzyme
METSSFWTILLNVVFINKSRKSMLKTGLLLSSTLTVLWLLLSSISFRKSQPPNLLFICVDDLRPDLNCYGNPVIHSPNLDKLAAEATLFNRHYVTQPTCGASRYSLLTGKLPQTTNHLKNEAIEIELSKKARTEIPETFIDHFKRNGYYTVGIGKISHSADGYLYDYNAPRGETLELPYSWNEVLFDPGKWKTGWNAFFGYADGTNRQSQKSNVKPYEKAGSNDEAYVDGLTAKLAVDKLSELSQKKRPFFLGVGFFKPHLPFNAPEKYWNLYDENALPLSPVPDIPTNVNLASLHPSGEFNQYKMGEEKASLQKPVSDAYARKIRHAYYASISYVDAQIGKVLDELKRLKLDKNTVVVVWGDHGWHLGDQRVWGKHTIFEQALRSVLIIKSPNESKGVVQDAVVSSIDIYPTLLELCQLKPMKGIDGESFKSLLAPKKQTKWKNVAYSYYNNGISVRTDRYRYTQYFREQQPTIELYDHQNDPFETKNIAQDSQKIIENLIPIWEKGNTRLFEKKP